MVMLFAIINIIQPPNNKCTERWNKMEDHNMRCFFPKRLNLKRSGGGNCNNQSTYLTNRIIRGLLSGLNVQREIDLQNCSISWIIIKICEEHAGCEDLNCYRFVLEQFFSNHCILLSEDKKHLE